MGERWRLEQAIGESIKLASPEVQEVVKDLQALRGIAEISAVTIVAELGCMTRFEGARQLMGYCGTVPSEDSSERTRRGGIGTKTGNAHFATHRRRSCVELPAPAHDWASLAQTAGGRSGTHQGDRMESQVRLHRRYMKLAAAVRTCKIATAVAANCWASSGPSESRRKGPCKSKIAA